MVPTLLYLRVFCAYLLKHDHHSGVGLNNLIRQSGSFIFKHLYIGTRYATQLKITDKSVLLSAYLFQEKWFQPMLPGRWSATTLLSSSRSAGWRRLSPRSPATSPMSTLRGEQIPGTVPYNRENNNSVLLIRIQSGPWIRIRNIHISIIK